MYSQAVNVYPYAYMKRYMGLSAVKMIMKAHTYVTDIDTVTVK